MDFQDARLFRERRELTESAGIIWIDVPGRATGTRPRGGHPGTLEVPWEGHEDVSNHTGSAGEPKPQNRLVLLAGDGPAEVIERVGPPLPWRDGGTTGSFRYQVVDELGRDDFEAISNPPYRLPAPAVQAPPR